ncbi:hypothetical protein BJ165DRAFT_1411174 [Panaeolus papilionaceus]|nr:hypothetical protein BJ165DRAFT_1411174 [Panaeolus papilionaceus]
MKPTEASSHKAKQRSEAHRNGKVQELRTKHQSHGMMQHPTARGALHPSEDENHGERMLERDNNKTCTPHPQGQSRGAGSQGEYGMEQNKNAKSERSTRALMCSNANKEKPFPKGGTNNSNPGQLNERECQRERHGEEKDPERIYEFHKLESSQEVAENAVTRSTNNEN